MCEDFYQLALQGRHPDIINQQNYHPLKLVNTAISLHLRDIFIGLSQAFSQKILSLNKSDIENLIQNIESYQAVYLDDVLEDEFSSFIEAGKSLTEFNRNHPRWIEFERSYQNLSASGQAYFRDLLSHTKHTATLEPYLQKLLTGRYERYFWSPVKNFDDTSNHISDTVVIPVGKYGEALAIRMLLTTHILISLADQYAKPQTEEIEARYWVLLAWETATGRTKREAMERLEAINYVKGDSIDERLLQEYKVDLQNSSRNSTMDAFKEGIQSTQASISSLMAETVAGYETAEHCLEQIIGHKLPQQFSQRVPFGYTLPVIRRGRFLPKILEISPESKLKLSRHFREGRRYFKEEYLEDKVYPNSQRNAGFFGLGCPASFRKDGFDKTAIEFIISAYLHIFQRIDPAYYVKVHLARHA